MSAFYTDETLVVNTTTVASPSAAKIDTTGGGRATRAVFQCLTDMYYRFGATPSATAGFLASPGDIVEILGYENIKSVRWLTQSDTSTLFVAYEG